MSTKAWAAFLVLAALGPWPAASGAFYQDASPDADAELQRHLTTVREQISNTFIEFSRREDLVLEMAGTLDRAAQAATAAETRRHRWAKAIELLDAFLEKYTEPPRGRAMRFQAGVYRWAQARSWIQSADASPGDPKPRHEATVALDDAIARFRSVGGGGDSPELADNLRFRLAESLADRASLDPPASSARRSRESEAFDILDQPPGESGLGGYWFLLKADLLRRLGKPADAATQLEAAAKANPPPPATEIAEVKLPLLLDQKKFADVLTFLQAAQLDPPVKELWTVRARLAQLTGVVSGSERFAAETDLFRAITELRKSSSPFLRPALLELARSRLIPDEGHAPEVWESLATAYGAAGDPATAGAEMTRAATRALAVGQLDLAASYWLKAGGFLFQAGKFAQADALLSRVADGSGPKLLRARAGMLRAIARGRAAAHGLPGASTNRYTTALQQQIRDFPDDASTDEARWLLGKVAVDKLDRERAENLWSAIAPKSPRWLESRLAVVALDRDLLLQEEISPDRKRMAAIFDRARRFLLESIKLASSEPARNQLLLERARLDLTPFVGAPEAARELCEQFARLPSSSVDLYRARLIRLIAMVQMGRYIEAEREAQSHPSWRAPSELNVFFDAVRLIDECASTAETDLRQRRFGLVNRILIEPVLKGEEQMPPENRAELAFRETRALLFTGADREARMSVAMWKDLDALSKSDRLLRELGDTYSRLEIYSHDIDVQRLRMQNNAPGSLPWFDARYALALAYFRTGKPREAAQLIDSTAILRPELGGTVLHDKFIRLRQRLGVKP